MKNPLETMCDGHEDETLRPMAVGPTNEELERLWETSHYGHPADFAADVLERWGGWPHGVLGHGGAPMNKLREAAVRALAVIDGFALHTPEILSGPDYETATMLREALTELEQNDGPIITATNHGNHQCQRVRSQARTPPPSLKSTR